MSQVKESRVDLTLKEKRALVARLLKEKAATGLGLVHRWIEAQAARTPVAVAVGAGDRSLTYRRLNGRANQLARRLRRLGVGPEVLVGVCTSRSPDTLVALLAVLKAGGAYVPLDPAYPPDRLAFMLDDARAPVIVTEHSLRGSLPEVEARVIDLDSDLSSIDAESDADLEGGAVPANLAYVIYTSGSTGKPKGVQITHAALANLLGSMRGLLGITSDDALLAVTTLSFDIAALELFLPLIVGARVELVERNVAADGPRLIGRLDSPGITFLQATPATWRLLLEAKWPGKPGLTMLCGGEAMPRVLADRLVDKGAALWNLYGPTETTVWSSAWRVEPGDDPISIGRPIAETRFYVLDQRLRAVPVGVTAELYIGGAGLARGYRGRPALTAERFVPDPFAREPGARMYRTGDLARWRPDGTLECLGRVDHQVKVRGFRVELGEIEAVLSAHPGVREAAVAARPDATGEMSLAAYLVPHSDTASPPAAAELRRWLFDRLPEYMVPSTFMVLEALPLTPNGKVDRKALPDPTHARRADGSDFVPPRGPIEEALAEVWAELLGGERIGAHDNFFERGGHSLMALQLLGRIRSLFDVEAPLKDFIEDPTLARLARLVERALADSDGPQAPPLKPVDRDGPLPASFAQQRLWFLDRLEPGSAAYNVPTAVELDGRLDIDALRRALAEVVRRHEVLRTTFNDDGGIPRQVIADSFELPLPVEDLSGLPEVHRQERALERVRAEASRPFDLVRGPLIRATLIRLAEDRHIVQVTMHHIISDGWSLEVLIREVSALYEAFHRSEASPLPEPSIQYADYAAWQRGWLQGEALQAQLDYWTAQLAGLSPLELPTDRPRPAVSSGRSGERYATVPTTTLDAMRALGRQEGATLYMTLLAAFQVLLHRYSGQDDIAIGSPVAGRSRSELEDLIGFFVNTLVLRGDLSGGPGFRELLRRTRRTAIGAYAHQDLPFEKLVTVVQPDRDSGRSPLFQVMLAMQNAPLPSLRSPELTLTPMSAPSGTAKFDLTLFAGETPEGLRLTMEYSADLFDPATVERMLAHYRVLLGAVVEHPDRPIGALPMLTEDERWRVVEAWNQTETDYPRDRCLHELIDQQAARTPHALALICEGEELSYVELRTRADRLAQRLHAFGVVPDTLVGLCLERSVEMVVGLLGVLKAGGAYVPLDPEYPPDRLAFMVSDSDPPVLLTQRRLADRFTESGRRVICLDEPDADRDGVPDRSPAGAARPDNLVYMIYTSGSTGRPKGAMNTHRAIVNRLHWMQQAYGLGAGDRVLQKTPFSFDVSVWEFFWPLMTGATLVMARPGGHRDPAYLCRVIAERGVTTLHFVPSMLEAFVQEADATKCACLRRVICSGEALSFDLQERFFSRFDGVDLHNLYGPTEAAVDVSYWACIPGEGARGLPIGRPIANLRLYVLDPRQEPVPVGLPGELYIGGVGLARGYWRRPGLTAERFVADPFADEPGGRLYRTGDLARWRADGQIEYLGRIDHQVKIRGLRVELGEIEAALVAQPGVAQATVVARDDGPGGRWLVAYLVPAPGTRPQASELRAALGRLLPEYMVPSAFVTLEAMPLTPNGKLDRDALPSPGETDRGPRSAFVAPRGPTEETITSAWSEVLGVEGLGIHDNFFDLGGHSLLATRVISRLRDAFGVEVPLRALFESPTIAGLAGRIEALLRAGAPRGDSAIERAPRQGPLPLSASQEALWFLDQLAPGRPTFNVTAAVRITGPLDIAALQAGLNNLVRRHESLRTAFVATEGTPRQVVLEDARIAIDLADLSGLPNADREAEALRRAVAESRRPFVLSSGPLARVGLIRLGESEHAVLLTMHHLITDGWSFGIAAAELAASYQAHRNGLAQKISPPPIQYADFARWQRRQLESGAWSDEIACWRRRLAGVPPLELPTDRPRPPIRTSRGALCPLDLGPELSASVRALCRSEGVTPFMTLLAAFQVLLSRWSGQDDFAVGSPVANRTRPETERLIGYFVNMLAIRADLSGDPTVGELLARVREVALEAFEHQEVPLESLITALAPRRDASRSPLFQVMFVLQNTAMPQVGPPGLSLSPLGIDQGTGTSKFDLSLGFEDTAEGFFGSVEYNSDLFDPGTIERFSRHYVLLLQDLVAYPERRLRELSPLTDAERRQVAAWGEGPSIAQEHLAADHGDDPPGIHGRFEACVRATPDATALIAEDTSLTYAELNGRANRLARLLRSRGAGPEARVGLVLGDPINRIVAVLAVLKAGGAYVPMEPTAPRMRMEGMLADAGVSLIVVDRKGSGHLPSTTVPVIDLEAEVASLAALGPDDLGIPVRGDNLAYIIFTSGTTGRPKGVMTEHRALLAAATAWEQLYDLRAALLRHLQAAPFAFDVFTGDWVRALTTGGTLVACPRHVLLDPAELARLIRRHRIDALELVPALAEPLAEHLEAGSDPAPLPLRLLAIGSDTLRCGLLRRLRRLLPPGARVVNSYGLTEAAIDSTCFDPGPDAAALPAGDAPAPIGRPLPGVRAYVLDRRLSPVPPGVAGDLYVGGPGVARGYAGDPIRTAERFPPDPWGPEGSRMYATGDRARWRDGGVLELLGRADGQVKIRGVRVELAEVEAALASCPGIREAVVVCRQDRADDPRLIAWIVAEEGVSISIDTVRRLLRDRLPRPMIPSRFHVAAHLPRTSSDKVDRATLANSLPEPVAPEEGRVAPRDEIEARLTAIWEDLLGVRPIGVTEDFFDLGGHSLLVVRLAARIEESFGRSLALAELLIGSTIEDLAARLRDSAGPSAGSVRVELGGSGAGRPLVLVHPVGGGVACYHDLARRLGDSQPIVGLQARGLEGDLEPETDLERMAARYLAELGAQPGEWPSVLCGWSMGGVIAFEIGRQIVAAGGEAPLVVLIDSTVPLPREGGRPTDDHESLLAFAADLARTAGPAGLASLGLDKLGELDPDAIRAGDLEHSEIGRAVARAIGPERLRRLFGVYRANRQALDRYRPRPYPGRLVLIRAESGRTGLAADPARAWESLAPGRLTTHVVPGDHYSIMHRPEVEAIAAILSDELKRNPVESLPR